MTQRSGSDFREVLDSLAEPREAGQRTHQTGASLKTQQCPLQMATTVIVQRVERQRPGGILASTLR